MSDEGTTLRLGDHLEELPKSPLPASLAKENGAYPFICSSRLVKACDKWLSDKEAVVLGTGGVATAHIGTGRFAYSTDAWAIRPSDVSLDVRYLWRRLQHLLPMVDYVGFEGSGLRHLRKGFIRDLRLRVPRIDEQHQVAGILDTVDDSIQSTEQVIAKLQHTKQGVLHDLLSRGIDEKGELHDAQRHAEQFKETSLGLTPVRWDVLTGRDVCRRIEVGIVIRPSQYYALAGVPVLRSANVLESGVDMSDLVFMSAEDHEMLAKSSVKPGDLVTVRTGYPGTTAVIPESLPTANCVDLIISRPGPGIQSDYLATWINSERGKDQVLRAQGGLAQQHFNVGELEKLQVAVPPLDEQERISDILDAAKERIEAESVSLEKLRALREGLTDDLVTGRVRVPV